MSSFFDELEEERDENISIKPFHTLTSKSEEDRLKWYQSAIESLRKQAVSRTRTQRSNLATYRGLSFRRNINRQQAFKNPDRLTSNRLDRFIINQLHDMTETKVSQMTRKRAAVDVLPTNDENADKNAARSTKFLLDHLFYINDLENFREKAHRNAFIFGEDYIFITWDPSKGDVMEGGKKGMPIVDEQGQPALKADGTPKLHKKDIMTGDVAYEQIIPWRVFLQRRKKFDECEWVFKLSTEHVDDVRKDYPSKKDEIAADNELAMFDTDSLESKSLEDEVLVYEFWHKKTKHLPEGFYSKMTRNVILEETDFPYSHKKLPMIRLTDLDIPDQLNGVSRYESAKQVQNMYDNINTLITKNIYLTAHAKWVMPRGACDIKALGNDNTIVQYQGPIPPQLMQVRPNPSEVYKYRNELKQDLGDIYAVPGLQRGDPPKGVTAAVAFQHLDEKELDRASTGIRKANKWIEDIARMTVAVAGDFYQPDDGRMVRIVGKDNSMKIEDFDSANLSKDYDIRIQPSSALPSLKAGKIERVFQAMSMNKDLLSNERWAELLEFGGTEKMQTLITAAIQSAESENEDILAGKADPEVTEYEDHILHWRAHTKAVQKRSFKERIEPELQQIMLDHIRVHEMAMEEKAKTNPLFEAKLAQLDLYPIFPSGGPIPKSREQQEALVQGQSNRGEEVTGAIPATEPTLFPDENINIGRKS